MAACGFSYRTNFVWAKDRAGAGYRSRNQHEQLLVGVRGDIPAPTIAWRRRSNARSRRQCSITRIWSPESRPHPDRQSRQGDSQLPARWARTAPPRRGTRGRGSAPAERLAMRIGIYVGLHARFPLSIPLEHTRNCRSRPQARSACGRVRPEFQRRSTPARSPRETGPPIARARGHPRPDREPRAGC
jgi:hypothetical protein